MKKRILRILLVFAAVCVLGGTLYLVLYNYIPFSYDLGDNVEFYLEIDELIEQDQGSVAVTKGMGIEDQNQKEKIKELVESLEFRRGFHTNSSFRRGGDYITFRVFYNEDSYLRLDLSRATLKEESSFWYMLTYNQDMYSNAILNPKELIRYLLSVGESAPILNTRYVEPIDYDKVL